MPCSLDVTFYFKTSKLGPEVGSFLNHVLVVWIFRGYSLQAIIREVLITQQAIFTDKICIVTSFLSLLTDSS